MLINFIENIDKFFKTLFLTTVIISYSELPLSEIGVIWEEFYTKLVRFAFIFDST